MIQASTPTFKESITLHHELNQLQGLGRQSARRLTVTSGLLLSCCGSFIICFALRFFTHHDTHVVSLAIIGQRNFIVGLQGAGEFDDHNSTTNSKWILNFDPIDRAVTPVSYFEISPPARHARIDSQMCAMQLEPENRLEPGAIHPTSRTRI